MSGPCAGGARRVGESRSLSDHEYSARVAGPHETTYETTVRPYRTGAWRTGPRNDRARAAWCVVAGRLRSATGTAESALTSTALLLSYCTLSFFSRWEHTPYRSRVQRNTRKLRFQRRRVVPRGSCAFRVCSVSWATESHTAAKQLSSHSTSSPFLTSPRPPPPHQL